MSAQSLIYKNRNMNIWSSQEMKQAQQLLAITQPNLKFKLKLPSQKQLQNMTEFQASIFPSAPLPAQQALQNWLKFSDNLRSLNQTHPNSVFHMLTFTLVSILYQDRFAANDSNGEHQILQTLKCSLYSSDMQFNSIKHLDFEVESNQLKLLVRDFLAFMQEQSRSLRTHRINCALWIFQQNPYLLATFTLYLRMLLSKLGLEGALDYKQCVDSQAAITSIIQYFDLHYRNLGELLLFYEDGLFISIFEQQIVLGEYYENQREKEDTKKQLEIKSSVQANMIESFLVNVEPKSSNIVTKKKGIVASDVKLFNFLLESSSQEGNQKPVSPKQREMELQTPHFKQSSCENYQFQRKKKSPTYKPEEIRNQFQKLMMDDFSAEQVSQIKNINHSTQSKNTEKVIKQTGKIDMAVPMKYPVKNYVSHPNFRKTTEEKERYAEMFKDTTKKEMGGSFYSSETHCASTQSNNKEVTTNLWAQIANCGCRKARLSRNLISSKVVDINVAPESNQRRVNYLRGANSPKFVNRYRINQETKQFHNYSTNNFNQLRKYEKAAFAYTKPAFLNNLKPIKLQTVSQDYSKSLVDQAKKYQQLISNQRSQKFFSSCRQLDGIYSYSSKSTPKLYQPQSPQSSKLIFDLKDNTERNETMVTFGSRMTKAWHANPNFIQKMPVHSPTNKLKSIQMPKMNPEVKTKIKREINSPRVTTYQNSPIKIKVELIDTPKAAAKSPKPF